MFDMTLAKRTLRYFPLPLVEDLPFDLSELGPLTALSATGPLTAFDLDFGFSGFPFASKPETDFPRAARFAAFFGESLRGIPLTM